MKIQARCLAILLFVISLESSLFGKLRPDDWRIDSVHVLPIPGVWGGGLHAVLLSKSPPYKSENIDSEIISRTVDKAFVADDKLVIFGEAGRTQAVEIFDIPSHRKLDWFFCYAPNRVSNSLIASIEYYPTLAAGKPTDVLLIYDLARTPIGNRLTPTGQIPPLRTDRPIRVGIPVFPELNASRGSYDNHADSSSNVENVVSSSYKLISRDRLVFIVVKFDASSHKTTELAVVDLAQKPSRAKAKTFVIPDQDKGKIDIVDVQEISPFKLRLTLTRNGIGVPSRILDINQR